ncbi:MAG: hypothetical protein ABEH43_00250 [Flavobacteriales bacterium]
MVPQETRQSVKEEWEKLCAANCVHYINSTISDINNNDTTSKRYHWSELKPFAKSLKYKKSEDKIINDTDYNNLLNHIGDKPADATKNDLNNAADLLQNVYGFSDNQMLNM